MFSVAPVAPRLWWHDIYTEAATPLWSSHTKQKVNVKATSLYWVHSISSLSATPNVAGTWVQNPFCRDFANFALVWLDLIDVCIDIYVMMSSDLYGTCSPARM